MSFKNNKTFKECHVCGNEVKVYTRLNRFTVCRNCELRMREIGNLENIENRCTICGYYSDQIDIIRETKMCSECLSAYNRIRLKEEAELHAQIVNQMSKSLRTLNKRHNDYD